MINDPFDRARLLDLLRPPAGFELDEAIGTTYSLDLPALLVAPLAFTMFDAEEKDGAVRLQSLEVLESLRRYARKITLFCHAGRIAAPSLRLPQFIHLEDVVVECLPPSGGSFHPKVWVLRYVNTEREVVYRFVCLTRNLTFDRSWDTALSVEGTLRGKNVSASRPIGEFIAALPGLAHSALPESAQLRVERMASEVRRVTFEPPQDVTEMQFRPIGVNGYRRMPFEQDGRMLIMAPFLSKTVVSKLVEERDDCVLISTVRAIDELGSWPQGLTSVWTLRDAAVPEPESGDDEGRGVAPDAAGLHAKCYVIQSGKRSWLYTGSANATYSAFNRNVEFLVELQGSSKRFGIDALLARNDDSPALGNLLVEVSEREPCAVDEDAVAAEAQLEAARDAIVRSGLHLICTDAEDASGYDVDVKAASPQSVNGAVQARCWPATLGDDRAASLRLDDAVAASFANISIVALTRFLNVQLTARVGATERCVQFAVVVPIVGAPADREERVLRSVLSDRRKVIEYLLLLIADDRSTTATWDGSGNALVGAGGGSDALVAAPALLETLLRALDRAPERLDDVQRLVADLRRTEEGRRLLPDDFDAVWDPIWSARERSRV